MSSGTKYALEISMLRSAAVMASKYIIKRIGKRITDNG